MAKNEELMETVMNQHLEYIKNSTVGSDESAKAIEELAKLSKVQNESAAQKSAERAQAIEAVSKKKDSWWQKAMTWASIGITFGGLVLDAWATHEGFKLENDGVYKNQTLKRYLPGAHHRGKTK